MFNGKFQLLRYNQVHSELPCNQSCLKDWVKDLSLNPWVMPLPTHFGSLKAPPILPSVSAMLRDGFPVLQRCLACYMGAGINSGPHDCTETLLTTHLSLQPHSNKSQFKAQARVQSLLVRAHHEQTLLAAALGLNPNCSKMTSLAFLSPLFPLLCGKGETCYSIIVKIQWESTCFIIRKQ